MPTTVTMTTTKELRQVSRISPVKTSQMAWLQSAKLINLMILKVPKILVHDYHAMFRLVVMTLGLSWYHFYACYFHGLQTEDFKQGHIDNFLMTVK